MVLRQQSDRKSVYVKRGSIINAPKTPKECNIQPAQERAQLIKILEFIVIIDHHQLQLPCDCKNSPEEPINLGDGPGEDVADAVDSGHLGVKCKIEM